MPDEDIICGKFESAQEPCDDTIESIQLLQIKLASEGDTWAAKANVGLIMRHTATIKR